ncbi:MAG: hypothetical protein K2Z81_06865 [Cyanobacteria bacterium]|nr:hypothetical protein [Cyanobacteriota bacterium]
MRESFRKPVTWLMAQALVAFSIPLAANASVDKANDTSKFLLPINERIEASAPQESSAPQTSAAAPELIRAQSWFDSAPLKNSTPQLQDVHVAASAMVAATDINSQDRNSTAGEAGTKDNLPLADGASSQHILGIDDVLNPKQGLSGHVEETDKSDAAEQVKFEGSAMVQNDRGVMVVDNDYDVEQEKEFKWTKYEDAPGNTQIEVGARFPISLVSSLTSKNAKVNDPVEARLTHDITIGGRTVAKKGDRVIGHVSSVMKARRILHAELSKNRWMRANGCVGLQFDEIITTNGEHLKLAAMPARQARIVKNKFEGRVLGINDKGEVASPLSTQLKHQAAHLAIRGAASVGGVFSFGIVPAAYGVVGAINPSFAFLQPVGKNVPHRRLKGFAMGFVSGLPGGFLIADSIIKGKEAEVIPGDQFLVELTQVFTGEAASSASISLPGTQQKVRGELVKGKM